MDKRNAMTLGPLLKKMCGSKPYYGIEFIYLMGFIKLLAAVYNCCREFITTAANLKLLLSI